MRCPSSETASPVRLSPKSTPSSFPRMCISSCIYCFLCRISNTLYYVYRFPRGVRPAAVSLMSRSKSSGCSFALSAARQRHIFPQERQRCTMIYPRRASGSQEIGSSAPPQGFARSPGLMSTCNDQRQKGQWLREEYPSGGTHFPQCAQKNPSSFLAKRLFCNASFCGINFTPVCLHRLPECVRR